MNEKLFPAVIDSTMLSTYRDCPEHFRLGYVERLKGKGQSIHLHAGAAFATALEVARRSYYVDKMNAQDSEAEGLKALIEAYGDFECPEGSNKTLDRMCGALGFYFEQWPLDTDLARVAKIGPKWGVEFSFAVPLPLLNPDTGNPIIFAGRADAVVNYAGGLYICDEKTTSQLGASWGKQWELRNQFTLYAWVLREMGFKPAGSIVRGISILKTKYDKAESIISQPDWKIDRAYEQAIITLQDMVDSYKDGKWRFNLGESCNAYGGCPFKMLCQVQDPIPWIDTYFEENTWNPLTRIERKSND